LNIAWDDIHIFIGGFPRCDAGTVSRDPSAHGVDCRTPSRVGWHLRHRTDHRTKIVHEPGLGSIPGQQCINMRQLSV